MGVDCAILVIRALNTWLVRLERAAIHSNNTCLLLFLSNFLSVKFSKIES